MICWDGRTLTADKRCTLGGMIVAVSKLTAHDGCLIAASGETSMGCELVAWFMAGAKSSEWPAGNRDADRGACLVVVRPDGTLWRYENGPHPYRVESVPAAFGSGSEVAMGAMLAGADAAKAVEIASRVNAYCGNGVDWMRLDGTSSLAPPSPYVLPVGVPALRNMSAKEYEDGWTAAFRSGEPFLKDRGSGEPR